MAIGRKLISNRRGIRNLNFKEHLDKKKDQVESYLRKYIASGDDETPDILCDAMKYSLFAGGKRLRPILLLSSCELLHGEPLAAMPLACAVEMIHTYSLIHDDLPAMDNDDFRRGKPTNHKKFGDGIAILAGDGLLNCAFELMLDMETFGGDSLRAVRVIAKAAGVTGMIGGQVLDLEYEGKDIEFGDLKEMYLKKTGALISSSLVAGALVAGCNDTEMQIIRDCGEDLGLAFQIRDDILDVIGDRDTMGKDAGRDISLDKSTSVALLGLDGALAMVQRLTTRTKERFTRFGDRAWFLTQLTEYLVDRKL